MQANISALTQSAQNASNGIGLLQTADGALAQVSARLDRAITLSTGRASAALRRLVQSLYLHSRAWGCAR